MNEDLYKKVDEEKWEPKGLIDHIIYYGMWLIFISILLVLILITLKILYEFGFNIGEFLVNLIKN